MERRDFAGCFAQSPLILTEGAVGQRLEREYGLKADPDIGYASLVYDRAGKRALRAIYRQYLRTAEKHGLPLMLLTNTRRANWERVARTPYAGMNVMRDYALFLRELADKTGCDAYVGGMMGCKGDAYTGGGALPVKEAVRFHTWQANAFRFGPADFLYAAIMPAKEETVGMAKAMEKTRLPYIISFMLLESGRLPDGTPLHDAVEAVEAAVKRKPLCYMTNCIHPDILHKALSEPRNRTDLVRERFRGIQANAARARPEELDGSAALIAQDAPTLLRSFERLWEDFPMRILGGCCGTDDTHIKALAARFAPR